MNDTNSMIIDNLNYKFGVNLGKADEIIIRKIKMALLSNEELTLKAKSLSIESFREATN